MGFVGVTDKLRVGVGQPYRAPLVAAAQRWAKKLTDQQQWQPVHVKDVYDRIKELKYASWLQPIIDELEVFSSHSRLLLHAPIQHGKSTLILCFLIVQCFGRCRGKHSFYLTYSATKAEQVQKDFIHMCRMLGIDAKKDTNSVRINLGDKRQRTVVTFASIDGPITGRPITGVLVIDDPTKQSDAHSERIRQNIWRSFQKDLYPRASGGIAVIMSRWSVHDLTAKLIDEEAYGFVYIRLAAECDEVDDEGLATDGTGRTLGQLLWPEKRNWKDTDPPTEGMIELKVIKDRDPVTWWSLYQGKPLIEGARIIEWPSYYESLNQLPNNRIVRYGMDSAEKNDWAVIYRLEADPRQPFDCRVYYVTGGLRRQGHQVEVWGPEFGAFIAHRPGPVLWHTGGQENIQARFMRKYMPSLIIQNARVSPHIRSLGLIEAMNDGRVMFPTPEAVLQSATWVEPCVEALVNFDGISHAGSDDLVSLNSAFVLINAKAGGAKAGKKPTESEIKRKSDLMMNPEFVASKASKPISKKKGSAWRTPWSA